MSIWHISTTIVNIVQIRLISFQLVNAFLVIQGSQLWYLTSLEHSGNGKDSYCNNLVKLKTFFLDFPSIYISNFGEPQDFFFFLYEKKKAEKKKVFTQKILGAGPRLHLISHISLLICWLILLVQGSSQDCRFSNFASPIFFSLIDTLVRCLLNAGLNGINLSYRSPLSITSVLNLEGSVTDILTSLSAVRFHFTLAGSNFSLLPSLHTIFPSKPSYLWKVRFLGFMSSPNCYTSLLKPDWDSQIQI